MFESEMCLYMQLLIDYCDNHKLIIVIFVFAYVEQRFVLMYIFA